jgi:hypothetical protein
MIFLAFWAVSYRRLVIAGGEGKDLCHVRMPVVLRLRAQKVIVEQYFHTSLLHITLVLKSHQVVY